MYIRRNTQLTLLAVRGPKRFVPLVVFLVTYYKQFAPLIFSSIDIIPMETLENQKCATKCVFRKTLHLNC